MKKNREDEWLNRFKEDMEKLEDVYESASPSQYQLLETLKTFKEERKKAFKRELIAFLGTATVIFVIYFLSVLKMPPVFFWIQGIALLATPVILIIEKKRRMKKNGVEEYEL